MTESNNTAPVASNLTKKCKVCDDEKLITEFAKNPNAADGRNSVCRSCYGKSVKTKRGRQRFQEGIGAPDVEVAVEEAMELFRLGDKKKDFLQRVLFRVMLSPGTNQQSQLMATQKIMELHGVSKETPKSEEDLIFSALQRMREQKPDAKS